MMIIIICYLTQRIGNKFQVAQICLYYELLSNVFNMAFGCIQPHTAYLSLFARFTRPCAVQSMWEPEHLFSQSEEN